MQQREDNKTICYLCQLEPEQQNNLVCQKCGNCKCLCTCLYDTDFKNNLKLLSSKAQPHNINFYIKTQEDVVKTMQYLLEDTQVMLKKSAIEYQITRSSKDVSELMAHALVKEAYSGYGVLISERNYQHVLQILYAD